MTQGTAGGLHAVVYQTSLLEVNCMQMCTQKLYERCLLLIYITIVCFGRRYEDVWLCVFYPKGIPEKRKPEVVGVVMVLLQS